MRFPCLGCGAHCVLFVVRVFRIKYCVKRQATLMKRSKQLIIPRVMQSIMFGLILGSLFYQISTDYASLKFALLLYVPVFLAFGNMVELPIVIESKRVVFKQQGLARLSACALGV